MDSFSTPPSNEIAHDFRPHFCVYKHGRVERFRGHPFVPPSHDSDPLTGVKSKDTFISPELSARLYLPKNADNCKLPLIVYFNGGAFTMESAFSSLFHNFLNCLTAATNAVSVSVDYRLAPEHPIPACYDDVWTALSWVAQHLTQKGPDYWLNEFADFDRVFLVGDSAGANIAHNTAIRPGINMLGPGLKLAGLILQHPFFGNDEPDKLWNFICKGTNGLTDPKLNPASDPYSLAKLGCTRVLICVGGPDNLGGRGWTYYNALKMSDWCGSVEMIETEGEGHVFHVFDPYL